MARVRLVSDAEAAGDPLLETLFDGARTLLGRVPNSIRARAHLPEVAAFTLALTASLQREGGFGSLDGRTKEMIVLKTSMANQCDYCKTHNTALGQATGLSLDQINDMEGDYRNSPRLSDRDKAVIRWSEAVTLNQAARDKAAFEDLRRHFSDAEILEITWLSAYFNMSNRLQDSLLVDIEMPDEVNHIKKSKVTSKQAIIDYATRLVDAIKTRRPAKEKAPA